MASSCLLCLNIIKDKVDSIESTSTLWQELHIAKKLEKHFWPLSTMQNYSWLCLSCWQEVDDFHKFYLRIEEAHINFYKIKVQDVDCKEEIIQITKIMDNSEESVKNNVADCILEPEILIDQAKPPNDLGPNKTGDKDTIIAQSVEICIDDGEESDKDNMTYCILEPEILMDEDQPQNLDPDTIVGKETITIEILDNINVDMPLKKSYKRQGSQNDIVSKRPKIQNDLPSKDPLAKSKKQISDKTRKKRQHKEKAIEDKSTKDYQPNNLEIKEELVDFNDNDSDCDSDNEETDINYVANKDSSRNDKTKARRSNGRCIVEREANDKFITEHFKHMFCDICQEPLKNFPDMQKHFSSTHQQKGYFVCCKRKYFSRKDLIDHIHSHLNPDHFKCSQCGKVMPDRLRLDKHVLREHSLEGAMKKHPCDECNRTFADDRDLRMHKLTHLSKKEKRFPCEKCGKFYGSAYILHHHIQAVHLKKFVRICHICGKALSCNTDYNLHMNKHEGTPQSLSCDVCGLLMTTKRGLRIHKETQHPVDGKKEYPCTKCPKISPTIRALRKHIKTMHVKGGCNHKCTICEKTFKRAEYLKDHVASHTGTPLYTCHWCPKTFYTYSNMHSHRKKVHAKEYEEAKRQKYTGISKPNIDSVPEHSD